MLVNSVEGLLYIYWQTVVSEASVVCNIPLLFVLSQDLSHENSIWKQPGPVEALKQMLFRLQAVEAELQRQQQPPAALTLSEWLLTSATQVQGARLA